MCVELRYFDCSIIHGWRTGISISHLIQTIPSRLKIFSLDQSLFHPFFTFNYWRQNTVSEYSVNLIIRNLSIIYRWLWFANDSDWSMTHSLSSSDWSILTQFRRGWLMKQFLRNQLICCNKRLIKDKTVTGPFLEYKPSFRPFFQPFSSFLGGGFYHFGQLWLGLIDRKQEHRIYHSHENHDFAFQWIFMASEIMKIEIL